MLQCYFSLRQFCLIKWSFFIHSTTPYIHPRFDSRIESRFSDCFQTRSMHTFPLFCFHEYVTNTKCFNKLASLLFSLSVHDFLGAVLAYNYSISILYFNENI